MVPDTVLVRVSVYGTTAPAAYGPAGALLPRMMTGVAAAELVQVVSPDGQLEGGVHVLPLHVGGVHDGPLQFGGGVM